MRSGLLCSTWLAHRMLRLVCILSCMCFIAWTQAHANPGEDATTLENRLKAAFLFKFASYVDWPDYLFSGPDHPITIAIVGAEPIAAELTRNVIGRTVQGRAIKVKRLKAHDAFADVHIVFVGVGEAERLERTVQAARPHPILIVTDFDGALERGSMINFVLAERRLRFEVSLVTAEKSGLRLSSRLLDVALRVHTEDP